MAAFRPAVETWRSDVLELDVRATRDDRVVVIHDATVDRTTDGTGALADLTWDEASQLDAGYHFRDLDGQFSARGTGVRLPLFEEVLTAFPRTRINAEAKSADVFPSLLEIIRRHSAEERTLIAAERESNRRAARSYSGPWGASGEQLRRFWIAHRIPLIGRFYTPSADVFQVPARWQGRTVVTEAFVESAHARNIPVHVWTVDEASEMHELLDLGVDGIQTDRPDVLDSVFRERGLR